jgi:hypothetical protein
MRIGELGGMGATHSLALNLQGQYQGLEQCFAGKGKTPCPRIAM